MKYVMSYTLAGAALWLAGCTPAQQQTSQNWALGGQQAPAVQQAVNPNPVAATSPETGLVNLLVNQLGVNSQQAMGGVGSIFSLAQQRMNPGDFMQLSGSVPGMNQYLSAVPQPSSSSVLLGSAASLMGDQVGGLGSLAALAGSFQSLGMSTNMIGQFVPMVLQYVQGQSGPAAMSLLQSVLY
ncbi:DUF2780 domain-containing protein [Methylomonas methanica]|uniref:DUF2780 domain-containing protein n=1 Tax=Methylomonas methanica (strain DSM 25384 / MC09) TaxID=857087 RepID=F9ZW89_METMM|nr:DUF2780 domain-containing protein [Methylomonas methanica]AEG02060.1 hypothetical protein Metme_3702 [Methylomonas methanica MC09]